MLNKFGHPCFTLKVPLMTPLSSDSVFTMSLSEKLLEVQLCSGLEASAEPYIRAQSEVADEFKGYLMLPLQCFQSLLESSPVIWSFVSGFLDTFTFLFPIPALSLPNAHCSDHHCLLSTRFLGDCLNKYKTKRNTGFKTKHRNKTY